MSILYKGYHSLSLMKQLWSCNLTELRTCKQKPYWRHHSSLRKIFLYCGRCQSKQLWCLISIWAGYRILNKCTQNIHFPTELRAIFKLLLKSIDLNDLTTSPKIHSTDTLTWLMDWLKDSISKLTRIFATVQRDVLLGRSQFVFFCQP